MLGKPSACELGAVASCRGYSIATNEPSVYVILSGQPGTWPVWVTTRSNIPLIAIKASMEQGGNMDPISAAIIAAVATGLGENNSDSNC